MNAASLAVIVTFGLAIGAIAGATAWLLRIQ
jgi:hypothetical protein